MSIWLIFDTEGNPGAPWLIFPKVYPNSGNTQQISTNFAEQWTILKFCCPMRIEETEG